MVVNSKERAGTGADRPMRTRSSKPSTSIFMKAGRPWSRTRRSRVRQGTVTASSQTCPSHPPPPVAVASVDEPDCPRRAGLRLQRHDPGAEAAEGGNAVADVGADIECEVAGLE